MRLATGDMVVTGIAENGRKVTQVPVAPRLNPSASLIFYGSTIGFSLKSNVFGTDSSIIS